MPKSEGPVGGVEERLDGVAVAAVIAAHVLDVTEEAIPLSPSSTEQPPSARPRPGPLRKGLSRAGTRSVARESRRRLDGPLLGARGEIEHQQIQRSPLEGPQDLAEESELPRGPPRMGLALRRALELERLRSPGSSSPSRRPRSRCWSGGARLCRCRLPRRSPRAKAGERTPTAGRPPCAPVRAR